MKHQSARCCFLARFAIAMACLAWSRKSGGFWPSGVAVADVKVQAIGPRQKPTQLRVGTTAAPLLPR